jgi:anti-anti-sigma regulatory factor
VDRAAPGERDLADAEALGKAFDEVFRQGSTLVVDLSETTFIDSRVVVHTLMAAANPHLARTGGSSGSS